MLNEEYKKFIIEKYYSKQKKNIIDNCNKEISLGDLSKKTKLSKPDIMHHLYKKNGLIKVGLLEKKYKKRGILFLKISDKATKMLEHIKNDNR